MYDWPEARAEVDAEWAALRDRLAAAGIDAPERLVHRNADMPAVPGGIRDDEGNVIAPDPATLPADGLDFATLWRHPDLLFGQTCWGPMEMSGLAAQVRVVGQPDYSAYEGGAGALYSSAILMRRNWVPPSGLPAISPTRGGISKSPTSKLPISPLVGEMAGRPEGGVQAPTGANAILPLDRLRGARLAYNEPHSMSGMLALTRDLEAGGGTLAIFSALVETGAHRASIVAVAEGRADVCAIDCRTWHLARRFEPAAEEVEVVGWTAKRRGLPFIASRRIEGEIVRRLAQLLAR